jgi:BCCT family betaine/carnitine transporter
LFELNQGVTVRTRKRSRETTISNLTDSNTDTPAFTDWGIFTPTLILVLLIAAVMLVFGEASAKYAEIGMKFITAKFGWLYLTGGLAALGFCMWMAFGQYGNVLLGNPGEAPEYSTLHWIALMFTAGIGGNLAAWGFAEPIFYLQTPPMGFEPLSSQAMEWAHVYPMFHWGIIPWAIYCLPAIPIAYMLYVRKDPILRISAACEGALPKRGREGAKSTIDILVVLGLIGGTSTSLGFGVPFVSALVTELLGIPDSVIMKLSVLTVWTLLFGASAYRGLKKGIKVLADINVVLAILSIIFIFFAGPTQFILSITVNSAGHMMDKFWIMSLWTDPIEKNGFPEAWTIFYWAWWLAYAAFMGLFVGRISRGRTIKQLVLGVIGWGTLGTVSFLAVVGGYALHLESSGLMAASEMLRDEGMFTLAASMFQYLPYHKIILGIFTVMCIIFYATTIDSAAYVLASICTRNLRNDQEPPKFSRLVWAGALALLSAGLVLSGSLSTVQSSTILFSLPLIPIVVMMSITIVKWLKEDAALKAGL